MRRLLQLIFFQIVLGILSICLINWLPNKDQLYSLVFICYYIISIIFIWYGSNKHITPFIIFILTFGLFIGGRFFASLFGYDEPIFELNFFAQYNLHQDGKIHLMKYITGFLMFSCIGYLISYIYYKDSPARTTAMDISLENINKVLTYCFFIISPFLIYNKISLLIETLAGGYLSLYMGQTEEYASTALVNTIFLVLFGLTFSYGSKKNKRLYLLMYCINVLFSIAMGSRGGLGAFMLFILWMYSQKKYISLKKIILSCVIGGVGLVIISSFSIRMIDKDILSATPIDVTYEFLYGQGVTLMVFDISQSIKSYPILPYFQSLLPGIAVISSLITGNIYHAYDVNFSTYLCYQTNPVLFYNGNGLGWSLLSDLYLYGFRSFVGFCILAFGFGNALGFLEK